MFRRITPVIVAIFVASSALGGQISEDQQRFIEKYKGHAKNTPPAEALINTDPKPKLCSGFVELFNGEEIKTWINGVPAARWIDKKGEYKKGFFSLQAHSGKEGEVHFRNIKVKEIESGWKDLFANGDFSEWSQVNGEPVSGDWSIEDGVVHRAGKNAGSINTKETYKDFELRFDWKISVAGNSGIKYRVRKHLGLEYQILDDVKHSDSKKISRRAASLYDIQEADLDKPLNPPGEWNSGRIVIKGDKLEHWLNGKIVASIEIGSEDWEARFQKSKYKKHEGFGTWEGPIYLQDHYDEVWYRNVRIREL